LEARHAVALAGVVGFVAGVQGVLGVRGGSVGFAAVFIVYSVAVSGLETPASSILHRCVEDRQRSTMLSLRSLIQQLGAALGLIIAGAIADVYSTPAAWLAGAVFLACAVILTLVLAKRLGAESR